MSPRGYHKNETHGRAHKSINFDEGLLIELRKRQEHHQSFSDVVNHYIEKGVMCEDRHAEE